MGMKQRQNVQQPVLGLKRQNARRRCRPTGTHCAWVNGTIFGRDAVPEVNR